MQKGKVRNGGLCSHLVYWFPPECGKRVFDFSHFDGTKSAGCLFFTDNPNPMPACMVWIFDKATNISSYSSMSWVRMMSVFHMWIQRRQKEAPTWQLELSRFVFGNSFCRPAGFGYIYALSNDGIIPMPDRETACRMSDDRPELCNNQHDLLLGLGLLISYIYNSRFVSMTTVILVCFIFWVSF